MDDGSLAVWSELVNALLQLLRVFQANIANTLSKATVTKSNDLTYPSAKGV